MGSCWSQGRWSPCLLRQAGRQRGITTEAARLQTLLRAQYLHHPPLVEDAFGKQALALLRQLNVACTNADELADAAIAHFDQHPDAAIITSVPGLGSLTGARVLAEIGDDRSRFANARSLKAYAGAAPVTRASGKSRTVTHRKVKNQRLAAVGYVWAFSALTASPGARAHYDHRKTTGDRHTAAQRHLFNRLLWRASQIPDRGPNKVPPGMEGDECRRNGGNTVLSSKLRRRGWWLRRRGQLSMSLGR